MANHIMLVDVFNAPVRCDTDGSLVNLNQLLNAGNAWRLNNGQSAYQLSAFLASELVANYIKAAAKEWMLPESEFVKKVGRGTTGRTMAHICIAVLLAEQISPEFHVKVHKIFIESKILDFRVRGATEFIALNSAIDLLLPGREGKDNTHLYINVATMLRDKILGPGAKTEDWSTATPEQTQRRYSAEEKLCTFLKLGLIRDYDHLKEIVGKL